MISCLKKKRKAKDQETPFMKNGSLLLEELIAFCNGKSNPIRVFSAEELRKATHNYDRRQCIMWDCDFKLYKGSLEDRLLSVKKVPHRRKRVFCYEDITLGIIKDIVVGSQMSVHQNVLKLLGCCLETKYPTPVYEFVGDKVLSKYVKPTGTVHFEPLTWKCRLRIAMGIANAVAYLHTAFSRPVVHRDVRSAIIILDENNVAKLIDFSLSISIPKGEQHVEDAVRGRIGIGALEYFTTGYITEKVDVHTYGVLLLGLLAGWMLKTPQCNYAESSLPQFVKPYHDQNRLIEIVDPMLLKEGINQEQFLAFAQIALGCISDTAEDRPTMIDAAKQLRKIYESVSPP
ncbi:LOW QUALITY PROTEIN: serine/threonine-protein kinase ZRK1 [Quercus suber]